MKDITAVEKREQIGKNGIYGGTNANQGERVKKSDWETGLGRRRRSCRVAHLLFIELFLPQTCR